MAAQFARAIDAALAPFADSGAAPARRVVIDDRLHPWFNPNPEPVGDTVHVGVVGHDFDNIKDVTVRESGGSEGVDVFVGHFAWVECEFFGIFEHGQPLTSQAGRPVVRSDAIGQIVVLEKVAQTALVMSHSVVALVERADHEGNHFSFDFAECLGSGHHLAIEFVVGP